jgi:hypothetical protein
MQILSIKIVKKFQAAGRDSEELDDTWLEPDGWSF